VWPEPIGSGHTLNYALQTQHNQCPAAFHTPPSKDGLSPFDDRDKT